jgi:phosphosulfolactate synthase
MEMAKMTQSIERANTFLDLPFRTQKPRGHGLTLLIDNGVPTQYFFDVIDSCRELIDLVKFGWCTCLVTKDLEKKIEYLLSNKVEFYFGGTLFEKALQQRKLDSLYTYFKQCGCIYVEISNGTVALTNREKAKYISDFSKEFHVFSEVGYKDPQRSLDLGSSQWIEYILEDIEAGAVKVITESRESGRSGICSADGSIRYELIQEIFNSGINLEDIVFEAPNKSLQVYFIKQLGANVNLANIPFNDVIGLETLRLGLRSDTLNLFEEGASKFSKDTRLCYPTRR